MWLILFCHDNHIMALCLLASSFVNELPMANSYYDSLHYEKMPDGTVKCIEDEIPFELPEGWEWCKLRNICYMIAGKSKSKEEIKSESFDGCYPCYGGNGQRGYVDTYNYDGKYSIIGRQGALCGNVNIAEGRFYATEHAVVVTLYDNIDFYWNTFILEALNINQYATGAAQPGLSVANVLNIFVPLPPYKEQLRIAEALTKSIEIIKRLDIDKTNLQTTIQLTKSKILDLAIRGKLVPQNPDDEPASVLLDRIRAEKEELIKQGKIKRDKKESVIFRGDDNSYYEDIPESWEVASISQLNFYQSSSVNPLLFPDEYFELFSVPNYDIGVPEIVKGTEIGSTKQSVESKDVLLCKINPRINRVWTVNCVTEYKTIASSEWIVFRNPILYPPYINIYLSSPLFRELLLTNVSGVGGSLMRAQPDSVKKYPVVIPPYNEQKRIADKVSQLFSLLDFIAENVN